MSALNANVAPNSTKGIQRIVDSISWDLKILNTTKHGKNTPALCSLESNIKVLQHSLEHPEKSVPKSYKVCTRQFLRKAKLVFQRHAPKQNRAQPTCPTKGKKATKPAKKEVSESTSNPKTTGIIYLTGGTSEDDAQRPKSVADIDPSPLWFFDTSAAPVTISSQANETGEVPGQSAQVALASKEDDAGVREGLQASAVGQEQADTITPVTLLSKSRQAKTFPCEGSYSNVRGSALHDTDVLRDLQAPARKRGHVSFHQEASAHGILEATMGRRDYELWYDPTVDFNQDLLP